MCLLKKRNTPLNENVIPQRMVILVPKYVGQIANLKGKRNSKETFHLNKVVS